MKIVVRFWIKSLCWWIFIPNSPADDQIIEMRLKLDIARQLPPIILYRGLQWCWWSLMTWNVRLDWNHRCTAACSRLLISLSMSRTINVPTWWSSKGKVLQTIRFIFLRSLIGWSWCVRLRTPSHVSYNVLTSQRSTLSLLQYTSQINLRSWCWLTPMSWYTRICQPKLNVVQLCVYAANLMLFHETLAPWATFLR